MGWMFDCFGCCFSRLAAKERSVEPAATAERHYSLPQSESMANLIENKAD
jgi:hypothetical protein